jgi:hypothetical protein
MIGRHLARLGVHHTAFGNPGRFQTGEIPLRKDMRWRRELSIGEHALALALTWPLLLRYGYLGTKRRRAPKSRQDLELLR